MSRLQRRWRTPTFTQDTWVSVSSVVMALIFFCISQPLTCARVCAPVCISPRLSDCVVLCRQKAALWAGKGAGFSNSWDGCWEIAESQATVTDKVRLPASQWGVPPLFHHRRKTFCSFSQAVHQSPARSSLLMWCIQPRQSSERCVIVPESLLHY